MAPEGMTLEHWDQPEFKDWAAKWEAMMGWLTGLQYFRANLKLGPGGETGPVNDMLQRTNERIGANIMGKRMFEGGEKGWPEEAPFHTPVFVLTHTQREPWPRPGGTTFYFVNDGRGPADFKISQGSQDKTIVEFKLASNSQLRRNLQRQAEIYKNASDAKNAIKAITYFSQGELDRVTDILKDLGVLGHPDIVLIDARSDNKPSASKA
ncbi:MAG: hypothetical protein WD906_06165 [Anaerolineales bacterium]